MEHMRELVNAMREGTIMTHNENSAIIETAIDVHGLEEKTHAEAQRRKEGSN